MARETNWVGDQLQAERVALLTLQPRGPGRCVARHWRHAVVNCLRSSGVYLLTWFRQSAAARLRLNAVAQQNLSTISHRGDAVGPHPPAALYAGFYGGDCVRETRRPSVCPS